MEISVEDLHNLIELRVSVITALARARKCAFAKPSRELSLAITKLQEAQMWISLIKDQAATQAGAQGGEE